MGHSADVPFRPALDAVRRDLIPGGCDDTNAVYGLGLVVLPFALSLLDRAPAGEPVTKAQRTRPGVLASYQRNHAAD
jgi:hypothetical protein